MSVAGVVAEYNPFHKGHAYQVEESRKAGCEYVVAVMSGNYVQRGEPALMLKQARAKAAALNGVDLIIELPTVWATAGAMFFARGALHLLDGLGVVDYLSFGSESADAELLQKAAAALDSPELNSGIIGENMIKGDTFAKARSQAVKNLFGKEVAKTLENPNDTLAVEYIRAINSLGSDLKILPVKRKGVGHDQEGDFDGFASASQVRSNILKNLPVYDFLPDASNKILTEEILAGRAPADYAKLETAVLYALRSKTAEEIAKAPDISEGIENRIHTAAAEAENLSELFEKAKSKRYTHARIRRIVLNSFLGIEASALYTLPPYIRVLAVGQGGKELLRHAGKRAKLPIVMKAADVKKLDDGAKTIFDIECRATDIYGLSLPKPLASGREYRAEVFVL